MDFSREARNLCAQRIIPILHRPPLLAHDELAARLDGRITLFFMHNTYLRHLRCRWSLSQDELAELLDVSQGRISRYEKGEEHPTLGVVLALQVIFGRSPRSLVSALYDSVEEAVVGRAAAFERRVSGKKDYASVKKQHLLSAMMQRATKRSGA